jgi:hypothetical protein
MRSPLNFRALGCVPRAPLKYDQYTAFSNRKKFKHSREYIPNDLIIAWLASASTVSIKLQQDARELA